LARGKAEMQNCIGLERFVEHFEFSRGLSIVDWQHSGFDFDAEACQSRSMSAKRMDQQRRWVVARAGEIYRNLWQERAMAPLSRWQGPSQNNA
jgi:hypothetical protein